MIVEISVAVNYVLSQLYSKLPRRRVNCYGEELEKCLHKKFQAHWFPHDPQKDSSYRSLHTSGPNTDTSFTDAALATGLDWSEIRMFLPADLVIDVDPGYVATHFNNSTNNSPNENAWASVAAGGSSNSSGCSSASSEGSGCNNTKQVLYSELNVDSNSNLSKSLDSGAGSVFIPEDTFDVLSNGSGNNSLTMSGQTLLNKDISSMFESMPWKQEDSYKSKSAPNTANWNNLKSNPLTTNRIQSITTQNELLSMDPMLVAKSGSNIHASFTAASFAQTKFGSTKLKNQSKRNKRIISPTEIPMNSNKEHESLNNTRCELSSSKLEMLREAIQQQQQLLNFVNFPNAGSFSSNGNIYPNNSSTSGTRPDVWQPPAPIGSSRGVKQSCNNMQMENYEINQQDDCSNVFSMGSSGLRNNDNQFGWPKTSNNMNNNIWDNNGSDEQNLLSFELAKILSLDLGKNVIDDYFSTDKKPGSNSEYCELDFNVSNQSNNETMSMSNLWSNSSMCGNLTNNPWASDFSSFSSGPGDIFQGVDSTGMINDSKQDYDSFLGFGSGKTTDFGGQKNNKLLTTSNEEN